MTTEEKIKIMNSYVEGELIQVYSYITHEISYLSKYNEPVWDFEDNKYAVLKDNIIEIKNKVIETFDFEKSVDLIDTIDSDYFKDVENPIHKLTILCEELLDEICKPQYNVDKETILIKDYVIVMRKNFTDLYLSLKLPLIKETTISCDDEQE